MGIKKGAEKSFEIHDLLRAVIVINDMLSDRINLI
jgi:hypothetical protein